jgi:hypothetical protein
MRDLILGNSNKIEVTGDCSVIGIECKRKAGVALKAYLAVDRSGIASC